MGLVVLPHPLLLNLFLDLHGSKLPFLLSILFSISFLEPLLLIAISFLPSIISPRIQTENNTLDKMSPSATPKHATPKSNHQTPSSSSSKPIHPNATSHYEHKRDSILTSLNQSSFVNGSQYALLLVSPSGQVESYASSILEPNLSRWFANDGKDSSNGGGMSIAQEATNIFNLNPIESHMDHATPPLMNSRFQNINPSSSSSPSSPSHAQLVNGMVRPATVAPVVVVSRGDGDENLDLINGETEEMDGNIKGSRGKKRARERPNVAPIDINVVNQRHLLDYQRDGLLSAGGNGNGHHNQQLLSSNEYPQPPHSAPLPIHHREHDQDRNGMVQMGMGMENPDTPTVGTMPLHHPYEPMQEIYLATHNDRTSFFELRLQQMQSVVCKTIAKAWIKVIEPKKQSYHPYKLGEAAKPAWWPAGSRHREPDHLFLPERKNLIIGLLRSPHTNISALQTATAEIPSRIIRPDKAALLMDVYAVAREEENMRYSGADLDTPMRIRVSTLNGWNPEAEESSTPSASAMEKSKSMGPSTTASSSSSNPRKRPSPPAMGRTASEGRKRQALDSTASIADQNSASQAQAAAGLVIDANSQWRWQQQSGPSIHSTPVRQSSSHLVHASEPRSQAGYYHGAATTSNAPMSAQIPYANLYPLGSPFGPPAEQSHLQLNSQHHSSLDSTSASLLSQHRGSLSTPFSFAPLPQTNDDHLLHHHQQVMLHSSPELMQQQSQEEGSSALGLHGIENGPQDGQLGGSQSMSQQSLHHNDHLLHRRDIANMSADSSGELSFDSTGYADSYLSSNGPRTPTPGHTPSPGPVRPFDDLGLEGNDVGSQRQRRRGISNGSAGFNGGASSSSQQNGLGAKEELDRIQQQLDAFEWNQHGLIQHGTLA